MTKRTILAIKWSYERSLKWLIFLCFIVLCTSCTKCCLYQEEISTVVKERIDQTVTWGECCTIENYISQVSCKELTIEEAVQLALLNHPDIQVLFERYGIAQADLLQAGLFRNPVFDLVFRFPDRSDLHTDIEFSVALHFLDVFFVPLRKRVATFELRQVESEVAHAILHIALEVEKAYIDLLAENRRFNLLCKLYELREGEYEVAEALLDAGNINENSFSVYQIMLSRAELDLRNSERRLDVKYLRLNELLGLSDRCICWDICEFPCLPCEEPCLCTLEDWALNCRLDLEASRWEMAKIAKTYSLKHWWNIFDPLLGIGGEREPEGEWIIGPAIAGEIPIFDYGQAERAKVRALYRQSIDEYLSLRLAILNEVQSLSSNIQHLRGMICEYENTLLPSTKRKFEQVEQLYHIMASDVFSLIDSKANEYLAEIDYIDVLHNYWMKKMHLKNAVGGRL